MTKTFTTRITSIFNTHLLEFLIRFRCVCVIIWFWSHYQLRFYATRPSVTLTTLNKSLNGVCINSLKLLTSGFHILRTSQWVSSGTIVTTTPKNDGGQHWFPGQSRWSLTEYKFLRKWFLSFDSSGLKITSVSFTVGIPNENRMITNVLFVTRIIFHDNEVSSKSNFPCYHQSPSTVITELFVSFVI